jgi:hypothetical protein
MLNEIDEERGLVTTVTKKTQSAQRFLAPDPIAIGTIGT